MPLIAKGDAEKLEWMQGIITTLSVIVIALILAFGLIQILPKSQKDQHCTYVLHALVNNRFVRINMPVLPRKCHD